MPAAIAPGNILQRLLTIAAEPVDAAIPPAHSAQALPQPVVIHPLLPRQQAPAWEYGRRQPQPQQAQTLIGFVEGQAEVGRQWGSKWNEGVEAVV